MYIDQIQVETWLHENTLLLQWKNSAISNCWISARGANKLHPFSTSAELSETCVPKGCNFIDPQALIQELLNNFWYKCWAKWRSASKIALYIVKLYNKVLWASILHWLGNISKLPNQCKNIWKFFEAVSKLPNQCSTLPNQSKMLAHRVCASILHWLGRYLVTLDKKNPLWRLENYPINVKCLHIGYEQAFYIDWVIFILKATQ